MEYGKGFGKIIGYGILIGGCIFFLVPLLWLVQLSLKNQLDAFAYPPVFIFKPTLANYQHLWQEAEFGKFFSNSLVVSVSSTVAALAIGVPAAYALVRHSLGFKRVLLVWILLARMAPAMIYVIPFFITFRSISLIDTKIALVIANLTLNLPVVIWLMRSFFHDIPVSLEESAFIDGANPYQAFVRVSLPVTAPGLVATGIMAFILSWNEFILALVLSRHEAVTAPIAIVNLMKYAGTEWGPLAAGAITVLLPALVFSLFTHRYLAKGIVGGALKE